MSQVNFSKYFNPEVTDLDLVVKVGLDTANDTGWEFQDEFENSRNHEIGETYDQAKERVRKEWTVVVTIKGEKANPTVLYYLQSYWKGNIESGDSQDTGDAEETIKNVIQWLTDGVQEEVYDRSWEDKGNTYQPAFAGLATQD